MVEDTGFAGGESRPAIALAPDLAPLPVTAAKAMAIAEQRFRAGDLAGACFVAGQLAELQAGADAPRLLLLRAAILRQSAYLAWEQLARIDRDRLDDLRDVLTLAAALRLCNHHREALEALAQPPWSEAADPVLHDMRANLLLELNEREAAIAACRAALDLQPDLYAAHRRLAMLDALGDADADALAGSTGALRSPDARHALALRARRRGELGDEMAHLAAAHAAYAARQPWPAEAAEIRTEAIIQQSSAAAFAQLAPVAASTRSPVFIVGMPRSGSTLVAQILAAHSAVGQIGEAYLIAPLLEDIAGERYAGKPWPELLGCVDAEGLAQLVERYESAVANIFASEATFVDKHLDNLEYVSLLAKAWPTARFIHVQRDPMDCCLSIYQQCFEGMPWAHDFIDIARRYAAHSRLVEHWRELVGPVFHTVSYEALVAEPERETRQLAAFLGLRWEPGMLDFHRAGNVVKTASLTQVRREIYQDAVARWKPYAEWLEPVAEVLDHA